MTDNWRTIDPDQDDPRSDRPPFFYCKLQRKPLWRKKIKIKRSNSSSRRLLAVVLSVIFLIGSMDMIAFASEDISYASNQITSGLFNYTDSFIEPSGSFVFPRWKKCRFRRNINRFQPFSTVEITSGTLLPLVFTCVKIVRYSYPGNSVQTG